MKITVVIGRAGCGKSRLLYEEAWRNIRDGEPKRVLFLVPEQATHLTERRLLSPPDIMGCANTDVLSFRRLFYRLNRDESVRIIDEVEKRLILTAIMRGAGFDAEPFATIRNRPGFIASLSTQIKILKRARTEPGELVVDDSVVETEFTGAKLAFAKRILDEYDNRLSAGNLRDAEDCLSELALLARDADDYKGATWYIDGFSGFTPQEQAALRGILSGADEANVALCLDPEVLSKGAVGSLEMFEGNFQTFNWLRQIAEENDYKFSIHKLTPDGTPRRFSSSGLAALEANLFTGRTADTPPEGIHFIPVENDRQSARKVAAEIRSLVASGFRYRDIAVVFRSIGAEAATLIEAFTIAGIPHFLDKMQPLRGHPLSRLAESAWELVLKNFHRDPLLEILRTGLAPIAPLEIDLFENYLLEYGLSFDSVAAEWLETPPGGKGTTRRETRREELRQTAERILKPLVEFRERITLAAQTGSTKGYTDATLDLLRAWDIASTMQAASHQPGLDPDDERRAFESVTSVLSRIPEVLDEIQCTPSDFAIHLRSALDVISIGRIPPALDNVFIGGIHRSRVEEARAVFVCGLEEGKFPVTPSGEGLFDERELRGLSEHFPGWAKDHRAQHAEEEYLFYIACTRAKERLYLLFPRETDEGGAPSSFVRQAMRAVNTGPQADSRMSAIVALNLRELAGGVALATNENSVDEVDRSTYEALKEYLVTDNAIPYIFSSLAYTNLAALDESEVKSRAGELTMLDASRLRTFANCPFQYFAAYDLKIEPRLMSEVTQLELGSFVHRALEICFRKWFAEYDAAALSDIDKLVDDAESTARQLAATFRDGILLRNPREELLLESRIYPLLREFMRYELERLAKIQFRPRYFEWRFGVEGRMGLELRVDDSTAIELKGVIDRIDIASDNDDSGAVAFDYKLSFEKSGLPDRMKCGLETQLPIYLKATSELVGYRPLAGLLYFLNRKRASSPDATTPDFKRRGIYIKGVIENEKEVLGNVSRDGVDDNTFHETIDVSFERLRTYAARLLAGDISVWPYIYKNGKEKPCTWCDFRDLCRVDPAINNYRHPEYEH